MNSRVTVREAGAQATITLRIDPYAFDRVALSTASADNISNSKNTSDALPLSILHCSRGEHVTERIYKRLYLFLVLQLAIPCCTSGDYAEKLGFRKPFRSDTTRQSFNRRHHDPERLFVQME